MRISVNPNLPKHFYSTDNAKRSKTQLIRWWNNPFILGYEVEEYSVWCLDGGAWDRPTLHGCHELLEAAVNHARTIKEELNEYRITEHDYINGMQL
jgi:hypothetical protein